MALSHRTFAAQLRAAAADKEVVPQRLRPLLEKAAKMIDELLDTAEQLRERAGSPQ